MEQANATIIVSSSAIGTASHTPVTPKRLGNVSNNTVINPKVRRNERKADSFPFDNAVNVAEVKIFSPQNRKLKEKIKNPFLAISCIALIISILHIVPPLFDAAWAAIILCGIPIILEAVIELVTEFDIKADVLAGNLNMMQENGISVSKENQFIVPNYLDSGCTMSYLAVEGQSVGLLAFIRHTVPGCCQYDRTNQTDGCYICAVDRR